MLGPCSFCPLLCPSLMKCYFGISNFLENISSLSHCIFFPLFLPPPPFYFFALITEKGFLIFPCYSLELCIQMDISFFFPLPFTSVLFSALYKVTSDNHFAFLNFLFLGMILITTSHPISQTSAIVL